MFCFLAAVLPVARNGRFVGEGQLIVSREIAMNDEAVKKVEEPDQSKYTSPIDEVSLKSSCVWNGEEFPEWYKVCRNGRVYQCLD